MRPLRIQKRCNVFQIYYIQRSTSEFKIVTSLQITWKWLRREMYLPILKVFRIERISAVVYSKCIRLHSLDRIKCTRLSHQYPKYFYFRLRRLLKRWKIDISWDSPILNIIKTQGQNICSDSHVRINYVFELQHYTKYYFFKVNSIAGSNCWGISSSFLLLLRWHHIPMRTFAFLIDFSQLTLYFFSFLSRF